MKLFLAVLALTIACSAAADCPKAADWARAFYSQHYSFYSDAPDPILQLTTPEFGELLKKEWAYSNGEVGHMDYDPWLGAYPYVLDHKRSPERHTVHLILRKREHECWQLHDFITPPGESLSYVYSAAP